MSKISSTFIVFLISDFLCILTFRMFSVPELATFILSFSWTKRRRKSRGKTLQYLTSPLWKKRIDTEFMNISLAFWLTMTSHYILCCQWKKQRLKTKLNAIVHEPVKQFSAYIKILLCWLKGTVHQFYMGNSSKCLHLFRSLWPPRSNL